VPNYNDQLTCQPKDICSIKFTGRISWSKIRGLPQKMRGRFSFYVHLKRIGDLSDQFVN
jgi:hypothetical protein